MSADPGVLRLQGVDIAYRMSGLPTGSPVVLIHGWASSNRMWDSLTAGLADRYRCVAPDLPGHGDSNKPPMDWYTIDHFAGIVADLCRALELRSVALIGHSMGGTIALALAANGGADLSQVIAINPVITGRFTTGGVLGSPVARPLAGVTRRAWPMAMRLVRRAPAVGRAWPDTWRRMSEDMGRTSGDAAVGSIRAVRGRDLTGELERIRIPVLIMVGEKDRTVPASEGRLAAERIPTARMLSLSAGHHPHDESPQEFLAALRSFLPMARAA
ncbi:MAG: alpha/beta fold hydrolase [Anaerolineales bacterium]